MIITLEYNRLKLSLCVRAVRSMIFALFFPLIPWIFAMILILYFVVLTVYVASYKGDAVFKIGSNGTNDTQGGTSCEPQISYTNVTINDASGTSKLVVSVSRLIIPKICHQMDLTRSFSFEIIVLTQSHVLVGYFSFSR